MFGKHVFEVSDLLVVTDEKDTIDFDSHGDAVAHENTRVKMELGAVFGQHH